MRRELRADVNPGERTGQVVGGKYQLGGRLGKGGMGEVYEAAHTLVGRRFAIKFLHAALTHDSDMMRRFQHEAESAGSLESENIVAVFDFGHADDGAPYIVLEYLDGVDLAVLLRREGPLPIRRAADLILQACRGLHAAHAQQIVHRDLKPENLFIVRRSDGSDLLKVLDFGIAKLRSETTSGVSTKTGAVIGTLPYMPPEQLRGERETDHRADVYALGAILYETLTGKRPHPSKDIPSLMYHILHEEPLRVDSQREGVPLALANAVHKALARDAGDRFESAATLAEALTPFAEPSGNMVTAIPLAKTISAAPAPIEVAIVSSPRKTRPAFWVFGGLCALAICAASLALIFKHNREPSTLQTSTASRAEASSVQTKPTAASASADTEMPPSAAAAKAEAPPRTDAPTPTGPEKPPHSDPAKAAPKQKLASHKPAQTTSTPGAKVAPTSKPPIKRANPYE